VYEDNNNNSNSNRVDVLQLVILMIWVCCDILTDARQSVYKMSMI